LALLYAKIGKYDEALEQWDKLLEKKPNDHLILNDKAIVYFYKQDYQAALECSLKAIEIEPNFTPALNKQSIISGSLWKLILCFMLP